LSAPIHAFEGKEDVYVREWVACDPHGKYIFEVPNPSITRIGDMSPHIHT
jgi:hypothetical protein